MKLSEHKEEEPLEPNVDLYAIPPNNTVFLSHT